MSNNSSDNESQEGTGGDNFADAASTATSVPFALNPSQRLKGTVCVILFLQSKFKAAFL